MSGKQYEVIVTPFAESALQRYYDHLRYELFAEQAANDWLNRMEQAIMELSEASKIPAGAQRALEQQRGTLLSIRRLQHLLLG